MSDAAGAVVCSSGYSGCDPGKNDPAYQTIPDVGPIPQGDYEIGSPENTEEHGPFVLPLTHNENNVMWGRSGFLIHGDSIEHPGQASKGCIILPRAVREQIAASGDNLLRVIA